MSLIFPKKEILYAPMLGTLGGGSARGFGRGGGRAKYKPSWTWSVGTTYTFSSANARGSLGPTYSMAQNVYNSEPFISSTNDFDVLGDGIQKLTIPATGTYQFSVRGAYGGPGEQFTDISDAGGRPYLCVARGDLEAGDVLGLVVGQRGGEPSSGYSSSFGGGGGGGSWVFKWDEASGDADPSSYFGTPDVTPLVVAGGGNGSNWGSWSSETPWAQGPVTTATDPIPTRTQYQSDIGGRGAYGASWKTTPYYFYGSNADWGLVDPQWSNGNLYLSVHSNYNAGNTWRYGAPALDLNGNLHVEAFRGGLSLDAPNNSFYTRTDNRWNSTSANGASGGFGGGGGSRYEGGGGGGYWGGVAAGENDYNTAYGNYSYGASSFVHPTLTQTGNSLYNSASIQERYTYYATAVPLSILMGSISIHRVS